MLPSEGVILIDAYRDALDYFIWRKVFEDKNHKVIYIDEKRFNFKEIQKFYKKNISYRMLFDLPNSPCLYKITKRKSESDLPISARKKGNQVKRELSERPYLSDSSSKKDDKPNTKIKK